MAKRTSVLELSHPDRASSVSVGLLRGVTRGIETCPSREDPEKGDIGEVGGCDGDTGVACSVEDGAVPVRVDMRSLWKMVSSVLRPLPAEAGGGRGTTKGLGDLAGEGGHSDEETAGHDAASRVASTGGAVGLEGITAVCRTERCSFSACSSSREVE